MQPGTRALLGLAEQLLDLPAELLAVIAPCHIGLAGGEGAISQLPGDFNRAQEDGTQRRVELRELRNTGLGLEAVEHGVHHLEAHLSLEVPQDDTHAAGRDVPDVLRPQVPEVVGRRRT